MKTPLSAFAPASTSCPSINPVIDSYLETNLRRERQLEGIAKAKERGVYTGRKPSIDPVRVAELKAQGLGATEIANKLGIGRASVYRVLEERA